MSITICPDAARWEAVLQGLSSEAESEPLFEHLANCEGCVSLLQVLSLHEPLEEALRGGTLVSESLPATIQSLMTRVKQMPRPVASEETLNATQSDSIPAAARVEGEHTDELFAFLGSIGGTEGATRIGDYRVGRMLGSGGMGAVFLAEDVKLRREVALKLMKPSIASNAGARDRFLREAQACAALRHENIVTIYGVGEDHGVPYLAMEFLHGQPLDQYLTTEPTPAVTEILRIGIEIAHGLAAAHDKGLIHRDIKPANIWLDDSGRVKILDFGLARSERDDVQLTQSGVIVGTPAFMAPEQARGDKVDSRSDLFSLGCVLYRMCVGENPFRGGTTMAVLSALALDQPPSVASRNPAIPAALSALIERLLAKDPEARPATAREVMAELQAIDPVEVARPVEAVPPRRSIVGVAVLLASLLLASLLALTVYRIQTDKGTLVVEIDDPTVEVRLKQNGVVVHDTTTKREFTLRSGDGELEVTDRDGVVVKTKAFTIARDQKAAVRVTVEDLAKKPVVVPVPVPVGEQTAFDRLRREDIPAEELALAGNGNPENAPKGMVAIFGSGKLRPWTTGTTALHTWFTPDGKRLFMQDYRTVRLWDLATGRAIGVYGNVSYPPSFHPDGRRWIGSKDTAIRDVVTGEPIRPLDGLTTDRSTATQFSRDGKQVAVAQDTKLTLFDSESGKRLRTLDEPTQPIRRLQFSGNGKYLAASPGIEAKTTEIAVWNCETGKLLHSFPQNLPVRYLSFLADENRLLCSLQGGPIASVVIYDLATGKVAQTIDNVSNPMLVTPDGKRLIGNLHAVNTSKGVHFWDLQTLKRTPIALNSKDQPTDISPDGKYLSVHNGIRVQIYDLEKDQFLPSDDAARDWSTSLIVSADGSRIVSVAWDRVLRTHDVVSRAELVQLRKTDVAEATLSGDGKKLFRIQSTKGNPIESDAITGQDRLGQSPLGLTTTRAIVVSPDGSRIATTSDKFVVVWDAVTHKEIFRLEATEALTQVFWTPDGKHIAASGPQQVVFWNSETRQQVRTLAVKYGMSIAFNPRDQRFAVSMNPGLSVFDLASDKDPFQVSREQFWQNLACSPDGNLIAMMDGYGTFRFYDLKTGPRYDGKWLNTYANRMTFTPDGRHLVVANGNGTIYVLRLSEFLK